MSNTKKNELEIDCFKNGKKKKKDLLQKKSIQNPMASTTPLKSVAPLKKKWLRIGGSLWETALMISWAKTPPTTAAAGLSSPNTTLKRNSNSKISHNLGEKWEICFLRGTILTRMLHYQLFGCPISFRAECDPGFHTILRCLSDGLQLLGRVSFETGTSANLWCKIGQRY